MALRFSPAPLLTHSATPPTYPAKAVMAATAAMATAPHDRFDYAAIPNDDALSWPRVPHGPEAAVGWRPPRAKGATAPRAAERRRPPSAKVDEGYWPRGKSGHGPKGRSGRGCQRAKGRRECPRAKGLSKFLWSKVSTQLGT